MSTLGQMNDPARRLTVDIRVGREHFVRVYDFSEYREINQGLCEDFAQFIIKLYPEAKMHGLEEFQKSDTYFDWALLARNGITAPAGFTEQQIDDFNLGGHLWITFRGRHYDAECPNGVTNFFELPFFKRQIEQKVLK